jgi:hypothetical protein
MTPPTSEMAQFLKEHSTTSIWALAVGEIALLLAAPDLVTSLHWKYLFSPVDGLTGKVHASAFRIKTRFSLLFLSLFQKKRKKRRKRERNRPEIRDFSLRRREK